jgi:hypothetical protein
MAVRSAVRVREQGNFVPSLDEAAHDKIDNSLDAAILQRGYSNVRIRSNCDSHQRDSPVALRTSDMRRPLSSG